MEEKYMINKRFDDINFDIEIYSNEYNCTLRVIDYPNIRKWVYYINDDGTVIYSKLQRNKYLKTTKKLRRFNIELSIQHSILVIIASLNFLKICF